ncbi:PH domain-containing protein [Aeromonas sp. MrichA-1]|uniref:PH domain-containing protein n=1 Tax=Aeromonas sp. MrichA-1 TaxID=2823362 RepID=UPI001B32115E|nr:PH domain-containing protein [Aeromonas sp. MrichA-1]MBP4081696.1 PH domain-containing protein [Aeromonas sp. MrichA-1]
MLDFDSWYMKALVINPEHKSLVEHLMIPGEEILVASKEIDACVFLTNKRIIVSSKSGMIGKKIDCTSIPYKKIQMYSITKSESKDKGGMVEILVFGMEREKTTQRIEFGFTSEEDAMIAEKVISEGVLSI